MVHLLQFNSASDIDVDLVESAPSSLSPDINLVDVESVLEESEKDEDSDARAALALLMERLEEHRQLEAQTEESNPKVDDLRKALRSRRLQQLRDDLDRLKGIIAGLETQEAGTPAGASTDAPA